MALADEAASLAARPGGTCSVGLLQRLNPDLGAELDAALATNVSAYAISEALKARNIDIGGFTLNRHRRGVCKCRS